VWQGDSAAKTWLLWGKYPPTYAKIVAQKDGFDSSQRDARLVCLHGCYVFLSLLPAYEKTNKKRQ